MNSFSSLLFSHSLPVSPPSSNIGKKKLSIPVNLSSDIDFSIRVKHFHNLSQQILFKRDNNLFYIYLPKGFSFFLEDSQFRLYSLDSSALPSPSPQSLPIPSKELLPISNELFPISKEQPISKELSISKEQSLSKELSISKEQSLSTELPISKQQSLSTELPISKEQSLSTELPLSKELLPLSSSEPLSFKLVLQLDDPLLNSFYGSLNRSFAQFFSPLPHSLTLTLEGTNFKIDLITFSQALTLSLKPNSPLFLKGR